MTPPSKTPEYWAWQHMKRRCHDPKDKSFPDYGGKGIAVCPEWRGRFRAFLAAMGPKPSPLHSLDRIDGAKGYQPGNVRWATPEQQAQNRAFCHRVTARGRTMTIAEWARELQVHPQTLYNRVTLGWPDKRVIEETVGARAEGAVLLTVNGETATVAEWARRTGLRHKTIKERMRRGWVGKRVIAPLERAPTR